MQLYFRCDATNIYRTTGFYAALFINMEGRLSGLFTSIPDIAFPGCYHRPLRRKIKTERCSTAVRRSNTAELTVVMGESQLEMRSGVNWWATTTDCALTLMPMAKDWVFS
jgi:hypothetical protein